VAYPLSSTADLLETKRLVEETGAAMVTAEVDVRDPRALTEAVDSGVAILGRLDIAIANAGVCSIQRWDEVTPDVWDTIIGVNLTGTWNTCTAAIPHLVDAGKGSIILISSTAGLKGQPFLTPYVASKHGMVGVMRSLANELASHNIRVNSIHPTGVNTPMLVGMAGLTERIEASPDVGSIFLNSLPLDIVTPEDISDAVLYLASDQSRAVTGLTMTVDAGSTAR
jgi:NAD(P)-dependent dehydrogenase (short-subunit alcohol dehydrogenase family)